MDHQSRHYGRVIEEWCSATGMAPWQVDDDPHLEVDGTTVGLIYDPAESPECLHVYFDLGHMESDGLHRRLLEDNTCAGTHGSGYFAIHPRTGSVVYRVEVPLAGDTDGRRLPMDILAHLEAGRQRLRG